MDTKSGRRNALDLQIDALQQELAQLKRKRNELSPIFELSVDILRTIFSLSLQSLSLDRSWDGSPDYVRLCHICHAWRVIALDSPELWTTMQIRRKATPKLLEFQLKNSKESPLRVEYCDTADSPSNVDIVSRIIRDSFAKRLRSLTIYAIDTQIEEILEGTNKPAEMLEELRIYDIRPSKLTGGAIREDIFGGSLPKLRRFQSNRILPWTSSILASPNLTELSMGWHRFDECRMTRPRIQQLLAFLSFSPQLKALALVFAQTEEETVEHNVHWAPIEIPNLETFLIEVRDSKPLVLLLPLLLLSPKVSSVLFHLSQASNVAELAQASSASLSILDRLESPQQLCISGYGGNYRNIEMNAWRYPTFSGRYRAGRPIIEGRPLATFKVNPSLDFLNLSEFFNVIANPRGMGLGWWVSGLRTIAIQNVSPPAAFWTLLATRPSLQVLSVTVMESPFFSEFYLALRGKKSAGEDGNDDTPTIPFPALRSLYLGIQRIRSNTAQGSVRKRIIHALENRKSTLDCHQELGHPLYLEQLAFVNCTTATTREELERFLTVADKVTWRQYSEKAERSGSAGDPEVEVVLERVLDSQPLM